MIRETAMSWWNDLSENDKILYTNTQFFGRDYWGLTGREIEAIYRAINNIE